jgi:DNA-binding MarR family transcriptional regulator
MASAQKPRAVRIRPATPAAPEPTPVAVVAVLTTKRAQLIALLEREGGASTAEMAASLGWLPHTTRAALTDLRKKGHAIAKIKASNGTRYSLNAAAPVA